MRGPDKIIERDLPGEHHHTSRSLQSQSHIHLASAQKFRILGELLTIRHREIPRITPNLYLQVAISRSVDPGIVSILLVQRSRELSPSLGVGEVVFVAAVSSSVQMCCSVISIGIAEVF